MSDSLKYKDKINKYFNKYNDDEIILSIKEINIDDAYSFINKTYKNYKTSTRMFILSKLREYIRILNNDKLWFIKINYHSQERKKRTMIF